MTISPSTLTSLAIAVAAALGGPSLYAEPVQGPLSGTSSSDSSSGPDRPSAFTDALGGVAEALTGLVSPSDEEGVDNPRWDSTRSPRHALMTFSEAMNHALEGKELGWERALRVVPGSPEDGSRREVARNLKQVLDRLGELRPFNLPGPESVESRQMSRFVFFPSADHAWVWEELEEPPRGELALTRDPGGEWRFAPETVAGASELARSLEALPPQVDHLGPQSAWAGIFGPTFERTGPWGWAALLASIFAGVVAGYLVRRGLRRLSRAMSERDWKLRRTLASGLATPLNVAAITAGIGIGLGFVHLGETLESLRWSLVRIGLLLSIGWALLNLVDLVGALMQRWTEYGSSRLDDTLVPLIVKSIRIFLAVLIVVAILQNILGLDVTGFLAGLGIAGLALSLAAKESVQNLFGSLTIFLDKPFRVGDVVRFKGSFGSIESIGLRSTRIRLLDGDVVIQPNMAFIGEKIENVSIRPFIRREMNVQVPYDLPIEKIGRAAELVESVLRSDEIASAGHFDLEELPPRVSVNELEDSGVNVRAYYWYRVEGERDSGWFEYLDHCHDVNMAVLRAFADEGIEVAYPTQRLFLADQPPLAPGAGQSASEEGERTPEHEHEHENNGLTTAEARTSGGGPRRDHRSRGPGFDPSEEGASGTGDDDGGD